MDMIKILWSEEFESYTAISDFRQICSLSVAPVHSAVSLSTWL